MRRDIELKFVKYKDGTKYRDPMIPPGEYNDNADSYWDAGLIIDDNTVVIDIDLEGPKPHDLINNIINAFNIETQTVFTDRGAHFYFDMPRNYTHRANFVCNLGMKIEAKRATQKHNSITVKRGGKLRKIKNAGIYADIPDIFKPIIKSMEMGKQEQYLLHGMEMGGRNNKLFNFRCRLKGIEDADKITEFVNAKLVADPLGDSEVASICQSALNYIDDGDDEQSEEYRVATKIIAELRTVVHNGTLYMIENLDPIKWTSDKLVIQRTIFQDYCEGKTLNFFRGVEGSVRARSPIRDKNSVFPVRFRNGIVIDGEFIYGDNSTFTPYMIDINYNPEAPAVKMVDDYLDHLSGGEPEYRAFLGELMGHTLITDPEKKRTVGKFFIFSGEGGNGKGTFLEILASILGMDNVSNLSPDQIVQESQANSMIGKLANLGDDIENSAFDEKKMKAVKNISTCDIIQLRHLRHDGFQARLTCSMIFTTNHEVKSFEKGESYKRRVVWLPMFTKVGKKDPKFISKLTSPEALSYWVRLMVEGYFRLYEVGDFTQSKAVNDYTSQYHEMNNHTIEYCREGGITAFEGKKIGEIYTAYEIWCQDPDRDYNPLSRKLLSAQLKEQYGLVNDKVISKDGVKGRFFYKKEVDPQAEIIATIKAAEIANERKLPSKE